MNVNILTRDTLPHSFFTILYNKAERERAAIRIQAVYRGRKGRLSYHLKLQAKKVQDNIEAENAALELQRVWRGQQGRNIYKKRKQEHNNEKQQERYKAEQLARKQKEAWETQVRDAETKRRLEQEALERQIREKIEWEKTQLQLLNEAAELKRQREAQEKVEAQFWDEIVSEEGTYYVQRETLQRQVLNGLMLQLLETYAY
jgi:hypothetical protein